MSAFQYILQNQRIPESEKTKEWDREHVLSFVHHRSRYSEDVRRAQQLQCWKYYLGIIDPEKESKNNVITRPYGISLGLEYIVYPLSAAIVEQVLGEYLTRPVQRVTYVINKRAKTKKLDDMYNMISEQIMREANKDLEATMGFAPETQNPQQELPEDIQEHFENGDYKTESEEVSDIVLRQVLDVKNNADKIKDLLVDLLVQDDAIAYIGKENSHVSIERCDVFDTELDWDPEREIQNDPQYFVRSKFQSFNEIINNYDLTPEEEAAVKSYASLNLNSMGSAEDGFDAPGGKYSYGEWFRKTEGNLLRVRCTEMIWISKREIRAKVSINKQTGKEIYKMIDENYKTSAKDVVKSQWIEYKRKVLMCGPDVILEFGPMNDKEGKPERYGLIDNLKKDTLPIVAIRRNAFMTTQLNSMVWKLRQLQDFASETLFELRLAMRRNSGKVMVYDAAQIPKQFLKTGSYNSALNRVMHHAKKDQFLIINSQDKQARYAFNQFTSLDLSARGMMQDMFNMLALIEQLASKFVGVSEERGGQVDKYQTATGTEQAVMSSNARTEIYLNPFESFIESVLKKVLMVAKYVYEENEVSQYVFGDLKTKFFKIYPGFYQDDIGVSIGSNYKEKNKKDVINRAAEQAFTNANTPELILSLIEVLNADTSIESEKILRLGVKAMQEMQQQNQQAMQQQAETQAQSNEKIEADKNRIEELKVGKDIVVAQIQQNGQTMRANKELSVQQGITLAELEAQKLAAVDENNS